VLHTALILIACLLNIFLQYKPLDGDPMAGTLVNSSTPVCVSCLSSNLCQKVIGSNGKPQVCNVGTSAQQTTLKGYTPSNYYGEDVNGYGARPCVGSGEAVCAGAVLAQLCAYA
jgi:hypothetical protein